MPGPKITAVYGRKTYYRVYFTTPGGISRDVTQFRGAATRIEDMTTADPFGDATCTIIFPAITGFDKPGTGDLDWLVKNANVDVVEYDYETNKRTGFVWEGFMASDDISLVNKTVTCVGALFQIDRFQAKPSFPQQPVPYEHLLLQVFDPVSQPSLRTAPLRIEWPETWTTVVPSYPKETPWYMRPMGVNVGEKWTGLTSRSTGSWEPSLTGFAQSLLALMHTPEGGQWTIRMDPGRRPVLYVRPYITIPNEDSLYLDYGLPGVDCSLSHDDSETANVVYAQGTDLAGSAYSGMQIASDGATTYYEPFAADPRVYPDADTNPVLNQKIMRKEIMFQLPQGVDEQAGRRIAQAHLRKISDPGFLGTITLTTDPFRGGQPFPRHHIKAGMTVVIRGLQGSDVLFHISKTSSNVESQTTQITVDTKFRDALTVDEVMARTRDSLDPIRLLQAGRYSNTVQDLILPWSYPGGSGVVPSGGNQDATEFFKSIPANAMFPWEEWTRKYPPKDYPSYYIHIPPRSTNADNNWATVHRDEIFHAAIPVRMSQAGTIRLTQIAAYDRNGNVVPVSFHVGVYGNRGTNVTSMPAIPAGGFGGYAAGQRNPFYPGAFEQVKADGTEQSDEIYFTSQGSDMVIAWGNFYEAAGYSPGMASRGAPKTGKLVDEATWSFDTTQDTGFDKYSVENTRANKSAGMLYVMIYCDDQVDDVYFLGRFFRAEAGQ